MKDAKSTESTIGHKSEVCEQTGLRLEFISTKTNKLFYFIRFMWHFYSQFYCVYFLSMYRIKALSP